MNDKVVRWSYAEIQTLFELPFLKLLYQAQNVLQKNFAPDTICLSSLLSVKTGGCSEDCAYCPQSVHYKTEVKKESMLNLDDVITAAKKAKQYGAVNFCISMQGRTPKKQDFAQVLIMIKAVKSLGLNSCATLGALTDEQILLLEKAGLDYYNHNLDTSKQYYKEIITTHFYEERLTTLKKLSKSKVKICCGGIIGMNESLSDRIIFLQQLANLPKHPYVVPLNLLVKIKGTPLGNADDIHVFDFIRVIAVARIMLPKTVIALAGGRSKLSDAEQALCFFAGASAMHVGEKLLVTPLPNINKDKLLLERIGLKSITPKSVAR